MLEIKEAARSEIHIDVRDPCWVVLDGSRTVAVINDRADAELFVRANDKERFKAAKDGDLVPVSAASLCCGVDLGAGDDMTIAFVVPKSPIMDLVDLHKHFEGIYDKLMRDKGNSFVDADDVKPDVVIEGEQ